ncbi:oligosaccharide flippase family protein [Kluyvera sichuanensis]|uniref:oligosaccharide flippase family protein n=1 Tax=Kluyvera sichuanensis TaxID=2725494 RepID=UPI0034A1D4E0
MSKFEERKKLTSNMFFLLFVQFSNYLAPVLVLPYLTRVLSIDSFGLVAVSLSIISISMIVTDYGFGLSATYWLSINRGKIKRVNYYIGSIVCIKTVLVILVILALYIYIMFFDNHFAEKIKYFSIISGVIFFQAYQMTWFYQGIEKMKNISIITLTSKIVYIISVFLLVRERGDVIIVLICLLISCIFSSILNITLIYKEGYKISTPSFKYCLRRFKESTAFFISRVAVGVYTNANVFIIGNFGGLQQAALYSCAEKLYQAGQGVCQPVSQALYPFLARNKDYRQLFKFVIYLTIPLITGVSICIYFSTNIITVFYGRGFSSADSILNIFLISIVFNFISVNFGYPLFSTLNKIKIVNLTVYIAGCLQLLCLAILYSKNEINSLNIAISVMCIEFIVLMLRLCMFLYFKRNVSR